jgi:hypothetical protein
MNRTSISRYSVSLRLTALLLFAPLVGCATPSGSTHEGVTPKVGSSAADYEPTKKAITSKVESSAAEYEPITLDAMLTNSDLIAELQVNAVIRRARAAEDGSPLDANGQLRLSPDQTIEEPVGIAETDEDKKEIERKLADLEKTPGTGVPPTGFPFTEYEVSVIRVFHGEANVAVGQKLTLRVPGHVPLEPGNKRRNKKSQFIFPQVGDTQVFVVHRTPDNAIVLSGVEYGRLVVGQDGRLRGYTVENSELSIDGASATVDSLVKRADKLKKDKKKP